jgi:hypothetical protein
MKMAAAASGGSSLPGRETPVTWLEAGRERPREAYCVGEMAWDCAGRA